MRPFVLIVLVQIFIQAAFKADQWDAAIALISWLHGVAGEILHEGHLCPLAVVMKPARL